MMLLNSSRFSTNGARHWGGTDRKGPRMTSQRQGQQLTAQEAEEVWKQSAANFRPIPDSLCEKYGLNPDGTAAEGGITEAGIRDAAFVQQSLQMIDEITLAGRLGAQPLAGSMADWLGLRDPIRTALQAAAASFAASLDGDDSGGSEALAYDGGREDRIHADAPYVLLRYENTKDGVDLSGMPADAQIVIRAGGRGLGEVIDARTMVDFAWMTVDQAAEQGVVLDDSSKGLVAALGRNNSPRASGSGPSTEAPYGAPPATPPGVAPGGGAPVRHDEQEDSPDELRRPGGGDPAEGAVPDSDGRQGT